MNTIQYIFQTFLDRKIPEIKIFQPGVILNIGAGNKSIENSIQLDLPEYNADIMSIPFADNSISGIHCYHFMEHLREPVFFPY